jgi:hypothetical protein
VRITASPTCTASSHSATRTSRGRFASAAAPRRHDHALARGDAAGRRAAHAARRAVRDVEEVIDASDLSADEKSALWLLGWSYVHPSAQRREAIAHLDHMTAATPPAINRPRDLRVAG